MSSDVALIHAGHYTKPRHKHDPKQGKGTKLVADNKFDPHKKNMKPIARGMPVQKFANIVNHSNYELSPEMLTLLNKGLSFVPSASSNRLNTDLNTDLNTLKEKHINKYIGKTIPRACRLLKQSLASLKHDLGRLSLVKTQTNMTRIERSTLKILIENKDLVICKAHSGDVTIILYTSQCLDLAYRHLNNRDMYQPLAADPSEEIVKMFNQHLSTC